MEKNMELSRELMENQLRLVMIDRMLKEKYNEIEYLAIQPPSDPNIVEINRKDLDWLLSEHEKCEDLEQQLTQRQAEHQKLQEQYENLEKCYRELELRHQEVLSSHAWRWGLRFAKVIRFLFTPFRVLSGKKR